MGIFLLLFWGGGACFSAWRARRLWRDPDYCQEVPAQTVFRFKDDLNRGRVRGWAPFSAGLVAMAVAMLILITGGAGQHPHDPHSAAQVIAVTMIGCFPTGVVLQFSVAWFNRPLWCVPSSLRQEPGVWAQRHPKKKR